MSDADKIREHLGNNRLKGWQKIGGRVRGSR
jgi:hypothetical protein